MVTNMVGPFLCSLLMLFVAEVGQRFHMEEDDLLIGDVYQALAAAETGPITEKKPLDSPARFIRCYAPEADHLPSSAYGPVQITKTLAQDYLNRHSEIFSDEVRQFAEAFVEQGKNFLDDGHGIYGYGGTGTLNNPESRSLYVLMAKAIISHLWDTVGGHSEEEKFDNFLRRWRGKHDTRYFASAKSVFACLRIAPGVRVSEYA